MVSHPTKAHKLVINRFRNTHGLIPIDVRFCGNRIEEGLYPMYVETGGRDYVVVVDMKTKEITTLRSRDAGDPDGGSDDSELNQVTRAQAEQEFLDEMF